MMKQDVLYCYNHPEEYPYEAHYFTGKQKSKKSKYFRSIEEIKAWASKHKTARVTEASWQVFAVLRGMA